LIKWIWYGNVGVIAVALLMLVFGMSGSAQMSDVLPGYDGDSSHGSDGDRSRGGQDAVGEGDSPLISVVKAYVKRFEPVKKPPTQPVNKPPVLAFGQLSAEPASFDFGKVDPGQALETDFVLTNTGKEPLEIEKIAGSPNCTPDELTKKILAPGEKVSIKVAYETPKLSGKQSHFIAATLKDPAKPKQLRINLSCEVKTFIVATPNALDFKVDAKILPSQIHLKCLEGLPFRVIGYLADGDFVSMELDTEKKDTKHDLSFATDPEMLKELKKGALTFKVDHPMVSEVQLPYTVTVPTAPAAPPGPKFSADATLVVDSQGVMAWLKLPGKSQPEPFYLGEKVDQFFTITKITDGEVVVKRDGYEHKLKVPAPQAAAKQAATPAVKKPTPKPKTNRRTRTTRNRSNKAK
jgi:hypothetical protein